ncbi:hypothetical protein PG994_014541 [Apiospora phragmitis]|uniref:Uncharacterized protein n=1 Tax=Apiospora phragmitis TaxID=2905665 RepID=A0ABR1T4N8_9PEZI
MAVNPFDQVHHTANRDELLPTWKTKAVNPPLRKKNGKLSDNGECQMKMKTDDTDGEDDESILSELVYMAEFVLNE